MSGYIRRGKCPFCFGTGKHSVPSDPLDLSCTDCGGTGTLDAFWGRFNLRLNDVAYVERTLREVSEEA